MTRPRWGLRVPAALAGIGVMALALRWTASLQNGTSYFLDDDSYWHYHLEQQTVQFGHRLPVDPMSWVSFGGRPMTHPPLFHYMIAYLYLALQSFASLFAVAYYFPIVTIILDVLAVYLLVRELYGNTAGLMGSALFAVMLPATAESLIGVNKPAYFAVGLCLLGVWSFVWASKRSDRLSAIFPGVILGLASLFWEGAPIFYGPLILGTWLYLTVRRKATKRLHILSAVTLGLFASIAAVWYAPIVAAYGLWPHANTPPAMLGGSYWAGVPSILQWVYGFNVTILIAFAALYLLFERNESMDGLTVVWVAFGIAAPFVSGFKTFDYVTVFGVILACSWLLSKPFANGRINGKRHRRGLRESQAGRYATLILFVSIIGVSAGTVAWNYSAANGYAPYVAQSAYGALFTQDRIAIAQNKTVLAWWTEGGPLEGYGARVYWDLLMESVPPQMKNIDKTVACAYLSNETAALTQLKALKADFILALEPYAVPTSNGGAFDFMLQACGLPGQVSDYFSLQGMRLIANTPIIPHGIAIDNQGHYLVPSPKAQDMLLTLMLENSTALAGHFNLIYSSEEPAVRLYQVLPSE